MKHKPITVACWGCGARLLDESEREWANGLTGQRRSEYPVLVAGEIGDHPYCGPCLAAEERLARHERLRQQQEALLRDPATLRKVNCAGCDRLLLGDIERSWIARLPKKNRLDLDPFPEGYVSGRPYCGRCFLNLAQAEASVEVLDTDLPVEDFPTWEELKKAIHL